MSGFQKIKGWFRRSEESVEEVAEGGTAVSTPSAGERGEADRETSTNAQVEGAAGQPWPGND
jgi:hypothetical protein